MNPDRIKRAHAAGEAELNRAGPPFHRWVVMVVDSPDASQATASLRSDFIRATEDTLSTPRDLRAREHMRGVLEQIRQNPFSAAEILVFADHAALPLVSFLDPRGP